MTVLELDSQSLSTAIATELAQSPLAARPEQIQVALDLLADGNTVPFIARYRKEATGGLDDSQLRVIEERAGYIRELVERKNTVLAAIAQQGKLTPELETQLRLASTKARVEDIYLPFKKRRRTKADNAREAGLESLAHQLRDHPHRDPHDCAVTALAQLQQDGNHPAAADMTAEQALEGARAILIDELSTDADLVGEIREKFWEQGTISATVLLPDGGEGQPAAATKFRDYDGFSQPLSAIPSHRILALFRGEAEGALRVEISAGADDDYQQLIAQRCGWDLSSPFLARVVRFGWRTKLSVAAAVDMRMRLKAHAEAGALTVFASNLKDVLLAAPAGQRATLGLDPGYRAGVKCAVVSGTGTVLATTVVYPHQPKNDWTAAVQELATLVAEHGVELLAIGNGTASRETEKLARDIVGLIRQAGAAAPIPVVVSEAGASVYSASERAAAEFPDMDVSLRGAVSIARRLQDPLAELVKIDPKAIGVGQYQHDVNQTALARTLDGVVEDAVNSVGVDVNTASVALLERVAGLSPTIAANIVSYRDDHGPFSQRTELNKVPRLGPKAFEQSAGFLRITGGTNPLDASAVHPEAYPVVAAIAQATGYSQRELMNNSPLLSRLNPADFANERFGAPTVSDIIAELDKPGRDPRPAFSTAAFAEGIEKISDLRPGMIVEGQVSNVAAFGAFVDIGVHQDGLVHISAMSKDFVSDPRDIVRSGDVVTVKVMEVDAQRSRISLSLRLDDPLPDDSPSSAGSEKGASGKTGRENAGRDKSGRGKAGRDSAGRQGRNQRRGSANKNTPAPNSAMAAALQRAGLG